MSRYFIEVAYIGTNYSGFQVQSNAETIQSEIEKAVETCFREKIEMTGASRTDTGVHARQNFFHFDTALLPDGKRLYNINALLPPDITVKSISLVDDQAHARFDAVSRQYQYYIYTKKDPFMHERGWFYPYTLDVGLLKAAAAILLQYTDFSSFAKKNAQVKTFDCQLMISQWTEGEDALMYTVKSNRFLRGMVRGLVGTMLKVGRGQLTIQGLKELIESKDAMRADFTAPGHGLFLQEVAYPFVLMPL